MPQINCPSACIGESGRSLGERVKEHFKAPSAIHLSHHHHRTPNGSRTIQESPQRGQQPFQDHLGSHVHLCAGPNPQQEPWEIPTVTCLGYCEHCANAFIFLPLFVGIVYSQLMQVKTIFC